MHVALVYVCWLNIVILLAVDFSNGQGIKHRYTYYCVYMQVTAFIVIIMHVPLAPPPQPPPEMVSNLTLGGEVPLEYYYVDDSNKGQGQWSTLQLLH